ncbi:hypothetical protein BD289DRAFT_419711 [Coniella lustricola]|uniref:Uncharacterized protein n=1 Tax=Coniella lustricola TaxID=2025994 RepID=A0A2T3ANI4_9PEZI|nr:hypothetical protein BD289DRAFT_419711 [Coniella lustricola]
MRVFFGSWLQRLIGAGLPCFAPIHLRPKAVHPLAQLGQLDQYTEQHHPGQKYMPKPNGSRPDCTGKQRQGLIGDFNKGPMSRGPRS